jgi:hypothetical protein
MNKAKNFPGTFVKPIFAVLDAVFTLRFKIHRMILRDIFRRRAVKLVNVNV